MSECVAAEIAIFVGRNPKTGELLVAISNEPENYRELVECILEPEEMELLSRLSPEALQKLERSLNGIADVMNEASAIDTLEASKALKGILDRTLMAVCFDDEE